MKHGGSRRRRVSIPTTILVGCAVFGAMGLLILSVREVDPPTIPNIPVKQIHIQESDSSTETDNFDDQSGIEKTNIEAETGRGSGSGSGTRKKGSRSCATVEQMGEDFKTMFWNESLRVREIIRQHFALNGASRIRDLPPEQFCWHGFVLGKASEAGFGNEMYKILSAAALSIMLNRSLIIGQTRHIGANFPLAIIFLIPMNHLP